MMLYSSLNFTLNCIQVIWRITRILIFFGCSIISTANIYADVSNAEKRMIVIIPSFNNQYYCLKNLDSVFRQEYENYHVIYIDDCSTDNTHAMVQRFIDTHNLGDHITLIRNKKNQGAMANLYYAIHSCKDHEIIVTLDGDDWFAHRKVLSHLNQVYNDPNIWLTYGQFIFWPSEEPGYCHEISASSIQNGTIRKHCAAATHLRTFYAGLFKKIKKEDLSYGNGRFYDVTWDKAMMAPMLEMAHGRWKFIPEILYVYNFVNPLSDARLKGVQQNLTRDEIMMKPAYAPLEDPLPFTTRS